MSDQVGNQNVGFLMMRLNFVCFPHSSSAPKEEPAANYGDADVETERQRVLYGSGRYDRLRIENLTKVYHTKKLGKTQAVDRLTLSIPPGEVSYL